MPSSRLVTAALSVAGGLALLTGGGTSYASWAGADLHAVPADGGVLEVESLSGLTAEDGDAAADTSVVLPGETVRFVTTAKVTAHDLPRNAVLRLDTAELFAAAPPEVRDALAAGTTVTLEGLPGAGVDESGWVVPERDEPYYVTAVITTTVPDLSALGGAPLSMGDLSWSLTQGPGGHAQ